MHLVQLSMCEQLVYCEAVCYIAVLSLQKCNIQCIFSELEHFDRIYIYK